MRLTALPLYLTSVLLLMFGLSCKEDPAVVSALPLPLIDQFPHEIGTEWVYNVVDTIFGQPHAYQRILRIQPPLPNEDTAGGKFVIVISDNGSTHPEERVIATWNNSMLRCGDTLREQDWWEGATLAFPLQVGRSWRSISGPIGIQRIDDSGVMQYASILHVNNMVFGSCYQIIRRIYYANCIGVDLSVEYELWFSPGVGYIRIAERYRDESRGYNSVYDLLTCKIAS